MRGGGDRKTSQLLIMGEGKVKNIEIMSQVIYEQPLLGHIKPRISFH